MKLTLFIITILTTLQLYTIPLLKSPPTHDLDKQNMFNAIYTLPEQLQQAISIGKRIYLKHNYTTIRNILFVGMADAGLAANITQTLIERTCNKPISILQNDNLPAWVDQHTIVVCISYSGNTREIISCFDQAHEKHIPIIGICSDGELLERLLTFDYDHVIIPSSLIARTAIGYLITTLLHIMHKLGCTDNRLINELCTVPEHLKNYRYLFCLKDGANPTYLFAANTKQYLPVILGHTGSTSCIAHRWVGQFAQNSKMISRIGNFPELMHTELVGWKNNPSLLKNCIIVWLADPTMDDQNKQHIELCKEQLQGLPAIQVQFQGIGANLCQRLFYLLYFGDWISYWYALEHATDPTPTELITTLKVKIQQLKD